MLFCAWRGLDAQAALYNVGQSMAWLHIALLSNADFEYRLCLCRQTK